MVDSLSDHQPYFVSLNLRTVNIIPHKYITINKQTPNAIQNFKEELSSSNIMELLDVNLEYNPNSNYDVLHDLICALKQKHFPNKKIKFILQESIWFSEGSFHTIIYVCVLQQIFRLFNYHRPIAYTLQSDRVLIFEGSNLPVKF